MLSGWWRSRHVRTFERNRYGTRSPAGQPAGRVRCVGVQEVRLQRRRPGRIQVRGFIHHDPGVGPGDRPGLQRLQGQRQTVRQGQTVTQERPGGPRSHRQDTGDLSGHRHLLALGVLQGDRRCGHGVGGPHIGRCHQHLQRRKPRLHPGHVGQAVQALIRQIPQRIIPQRAGTGRTSRRTISIRTDGSVGSATDGSAYQNRTDQCGRRRPRRRNPAPPSTPRRPPGPPCPPHSSPCSPYPHQIIEHRQKDDRPA